jgi:adenylate cyclase, class 2
MKNEIEMKARLDEPTQIRKKILALGAKRIKKTRQRDTWFGSICLIKKVGYPFMVRVRREGRGTYITYKSVATKQDGVYQELEYPVPDNAQAESMFKAMGLDEIVVIEKQREQFKLQGFTVCLDNIKGLGKFIEAELTGAEDPDILQEKIKTFFIKLGVKKAAIQKKGYINLLLQSKKSPFLKYTY